MTGRLVIHNRQRTRKIDRPVLRRVVRALLEEQIGLAHYELGIHLVAAPEMARINQRYLGHEGSTDVITFDHNEPEDASPLSQRERVGVRENLLHGELFVCVDDAVLQARQFKTTWQAEIVRYIVHGVLHLRGHDDLKAARRRVMKREENRLVRELTQRFALSAVTRPRKLAA